MIYGIAIAEYRSIGEIQRIAPLGKINLFVGPNNSGKSNVLRFIDENLRRLLMLAAGHRNQDSELIQHPHITRNNPTTAELAVPVSEEILRKVLLPGHVAPHHYTRILNEQLFGDPTLWLSNEWPDSSIRSLARKCLQNHEWRDLWQAVTKKSGGSIDEHWVPEVLNALRRLAPKPIVNYIIPIDRKADNDIAGTNSEKATKLGGKGVIRSLAAMQNPPHVSFDADRLRFSAIEEFVRVVTDDSTAQISVTFKQDQILVKLKGQRYLPLADLGSGVEQVVLHAVAATTAENSIVTFEEPELHLHPILQRQLLAYLVTTSNQYFISTHSAHIVDALHSNTFHVRLVDGQTVISRAETDAARYRVCEDLGYRPSDIVQANCVVWVEGPSDRIYLRYWLSVVDKHLQENVHFSIMFYGGKLLSRLSADETGSIDEGLSDLIQLRMLNRQLVVVMDSDLDDASNQIRSTKARVKSEIEANGGIAWVSQGREIENYIPHQILSEAVDAVAPGRGGAVRSGQFDKVLPTVKSEGSIVVDKVKVAQKVVEALPVVTVLDLDQQIRNVAAFIRRANGLPSAAS